MFGDVLSLAHVLWCFCGVLAVFRWCFGGIEETAFFLNKMIPRTIPNWHQRRCETLLLGLYAGLMWIGRFDSILHGHKTALKFRWRAGKKYPAVSSSMHGCLANSEKTRLSCFFFLLLVCSRCAGSNSMVINIASKSTTGSHLVHLVIFSIM